MFVVIGGAGRQGISIVHYLKRFATTTTNIFVIDPACVLKSTEFGFQPRIETNYDPDDNVVSFIPHEFDSNVLIRLCERTQSRETNVVINCLEPKFAKDILEASIWSGCSYIDLGGDTSTTLELMEVAQNMGAEGLGSTVIPACGLAPGIVSSIAGQLDRLGVEAVNLYCGGIPENKEDRYIPSFSLEGLAREYLGQAQWRIFDKVTLVNTLCCCDEVPEHPGLECFPTSGGLDISPFISNLQELTYETIRWEGHFNEVIPLVNKFETIKLLKERLGDLAYREWTEISSNHRDQIILLWKGMGEPSGFGKSKLHISYDKENKLSAMEQGTGFIVAEVAMLIATGAIKDGFVPMYDLEGIDILETIANHIKTFTIKKGF